jgi:alkylation response protein AidB-like acyl-CoA dehydrogenase
LTLTPISKRGIPLFIATEPDDVRDLRAALADAVALPTNDTAPSPVTDWRAGWSALAGLGLAGLGVAEEHGGSGGRIDAAVAAADVLGASLHGTPFPAILAGTAALPGDVVAPFLDGSRVCGFATYDGSTCLAHQVLAPHDLDALVLADPRTGLSVLSTDPATWRIATTPGLDVTRVVGAVTVPADACVPVPAGPAWSTYRLLVAADALGGVRRSLERAVEYARNRPAFGTVTGAFQAVQHRLVDHALRVRGADLAVRDAAVRLTAGEDARREVLIAEAAVSGDAVRILHDLLQLTGGIAFTWEHGLHLFERRAQADARLAANPRRALAELADLDLGVLR